MAWKKTIPALCLCACLLLTGCSTLGIDFEAQGSLENSEGERLVLGHTADQVFSLNYDPNYSFNPITGTSTDNRLIMPLLYDSMVEMDKNFEPQPGVVDAWSSEDGIHWTLHVAPDRTFQDGSALTSTDVYYSLLQAWTQGIYTSRFSNLAGLATPDSENVSVTLHSANYLFPVLLSGIAVVKNGTAGANVPVGSGMYRLLWPEAETDETLDRAEGTEGNPRLEAYSGHPDYEELPLQTIYLKEYRKGADIIAAYEDSLVDLVTNDPIGLDNLGYGSSNNEVRYYNTTNMHYLGFNHLRVFVNNALYRQALVYAVDRDSIVTDVMNGCAAAAVIPLSPLSSRYNTLFDQHFAFSLETCTRALEMAGVQDMDGNGRLEYMMGALPVEVELVFIVNSESAAKVAAARKIAEDLESIGFVIELRELPWSDYQAALKVGNYDIYYGEVKLTPDFDLSELLHDGGSLNFGLASDASYYTYMEAMYAAPENERQMRTDQFYQYLLQAAPIIPICFEKQQVLTHRNVVTGMTPVQGNVFYDFTAWAVSLSGE